MFDRQLFPLIRPRSKGFAAWCFLAASVLSPLSAAEEISLDALEGRLLAEPASADIAYELAGGYREAGELSRGTEFFARFHEEHEPNSMSLVWQGSLKTMLSSQAGAIEARLSLLQSGIADMDSAVRTFPDDSQVRLVRGVTISRFPAFLEMSGRAIRDLTQVLLAEDLSPGARDSARQALAQAYRQAGREEDAVQLESASGQ